MGTLTAALSWARRGFSVFPLRENDKVPISDDWHIHATTNPDTIRSIWLDPVLKTERDYNIGCLCTDMVVVDVDVKHGKDGYNEYLQLGGHYDTLVVRTPTGGFHCYFMGADSSNAPLTSSVDIRSHNGYVVAPGSSIDGKPYEVINDRDTAWVPSSIERFLRPPNVRSVTTANIDLDNPASLEAGRGFLESAQVAIQGQRGDERTFLVAARLVREMALSVPAAFTLMRDHWNQRCIPPWPLDELYAKVENAAAYGSAEYGRLTAEALFGGIVIEPPPSVFDNVMWDNAVNPDRIPPRPWLVDRALMTGAVTLLLAAGSAGKSTISLALAAHLALGKDFGGFHTRRAVKSIVYNGEDDRLEQSRRLLAVCMAYGFDYFEVKKSVLILSSRDIKMDLVAAEHRRPIRNDALVQQITDVARNKEVGVLILDPLVKIHKCDESDNVQMDFVMETLTDIAHEAGIAVLALHHTSKGNGRTEEKVGNMDTSRGASAIVNAARIAFTLFNASKQDAEEYGFRDEDRPLWVRMDDAKMNLSLATDKAAWFHREGVKLPNGDMVGVLRYDQLEKSDTHINDRIAGILLTEMRSSGDGSIPLGMAVTICLARENLWKNKPATEIKRRLESMFSGNGISFDGATMKLLREDKDVRITQT